MWEEDYKEKRKSERLRRPLIIQYSFKKEDKEIWDESMINDISETGASFNASNRFTKGDVFLMKLNSPTNAEEKINIKAKVIDSAASSVGVHRTRVEFMEVPEEQKNLLKNSIAWFLDNAGGG